MPTPSNMLPLGTKAPQFSLVDTISNNMVSLDDLKSEVATVVMFLCNHCPYVVHVQKRLVEVVELYQTRGVKFVGISSNDVTHYPEDGPDKMRAEAKVKGFKFPYLYDETQEVARAYDAACTPDFFVFDKYMKCMYRGRFDASTPGNGLPVTGEDLVVAINALLEGKKVSEEQQPSLGCSIKWKR